MRLFLALGLTLVVGFGAAFQPGANSPGREVGTAESSRVVGGSAQICTVQKCGGPGNGCANNSCTNGAGTTAQCNSSCSFNCGCGGS